MNFSAYSELASTDFCNPVYYTIYRTQALFANEYLHSCSAPTPSSVRFETAIINCTYF